MPLPTPNDGEVEADFVDRCMGDDEANTEFQDEEQRRAVCQTAWDDKDKAVEGADKSKDAEAPGGKRKRLPMIPAAREEKTSGVTKMKAAPIPEGKAAQLDPGWIEGYAAVFDNVDSVDDVIRQGAFAKTIRMRVPAHKVKLMATHIRDGGGAREVIGTVTEAKEDDTGLWMHAVLSRTRTAQEIRMNVLDGHIGHLSVGFVTEDSDKVDLDGKTVRELLELAWYETTVTTIPVNELAAITGAKCEAAAEMDRDDVDDPTRAKLDANRDAVQGKAAEMDLLLNERMELLDTEGKTDDSDTSGDSAADADAPDQDTDDTSTADTATEQRHAMLADILADV